MPTTPNWSAAMNGPRSDVPAVNASTQGSQQLGTHTITPVYNGAVAYQTGGDPGDGSGAGNAFSYVTPDMVNGNGITPVLLENDVDQPFTLSGGASAIGRLRIAVRPIGNGASLQISLCANNLGVPGTVLGTTVITQDEINQFAAGDGIANGGPLAGPRNNTLQAGPYVLSPWSTITTSAVEFLGTSSFATYQQFGWFLGGFNLTTTTASNTVYGTIIDDTGPSLATAQPNLPIATALGGAAASSTAVFLVGGGSGSGPTLTGNVYSAAYDAVTGALGSWGQQTQLPDLQLFPGTAATAQSCSAVIYNDQYLYVVGGYGVTNGSGGSGTLNSVYMANISNAQVTSWSYVATTPTPIALPYVAIIGDYLLMMGGFIDLTGNVPTNAFYYAKINPDDGTLGFWQPGPRMLQAYAANDFAQTTVTDEGVYLVGGLTSFNPVAASPYMQSITFIDGQPGEWQQQRLAGAPTIALPAASISNGDGTYTLVGFSQSSNGTQKSATMSLYTVPYLTVPMWVSGLVPGGTYHIKIHQIGGNASDYLELGQLVVSNYSWNYTDRYNGTVWSSVLGNRIMFAAYDQTTGINPIHLWEDPIGAQPSSVTTNVRDYDGTLQGISTTTVQLNANFNANPTFTTGVSPWTAMGGSISQSGAETQGGFPFSGLLTPSGSSTTSSALSELIPITFNEWYTANGWFYSPTGHSMDLSVNWYDSSSTYISTSSNVVTLTAATWTQVTSVFQAPSEAAFAAIAPTESGTPSTSDLLYLSNVTIALTDPPVVSSVAQVNYDPVLNVPVGTTVL